MFGWIKKELIKQEELSINRNVLQRGEADRAVSGTVDLCIKAYGKDNKKLFGHEKALGFGAKVERNLKGNMILLRKNHLGEDVFTS